MKIFIFDWRKRRDIFDMNFKNYRTNIFVAMGTFISSYDPYNEPL